MTAIESDRVNNRRFCTTALLIIGIGLLAVLMLAGSSMAATYNWPGFYTVSGTESYSGDTINAAGDVFVPVGATLRLNNTDLNFNGNWVIFDVRGTLEVGDSDNNNGTSIDASVISFRGDGAYFYIGSGANVMFENSEMEFNPTMGWMWNYFIDIHNTNTTFSHNLISGYDTFYMSNSNAHIYLDNNTFYSAASSIFASDIHTLHFTDNWVNSANQWGDALYVRNSNLVMADNVFSNNRAYQVRFRSTNDRLESTNDIIRSTTAGGTAFYIQAEGSGNLQIDIDNMNISNTLGWAMQIDGTPSNRISGFINNTEFYNNYGGIWMDNADIQIFDMDMNRSTQWQGINSGYCNLNITDSKIFNSNQHQIEHFSWSTTEKHYYENVEIAYGNSGGIRTNRLDVLWVSNSSVHHNDYAGIYVTEVTHVDILNTDVYNDLSGDGFYGDNMYWVNITDGDFSDNNDEGIHVRMVNVNGLVNILRNTVRRSSNHGIHVYYAPGLIQDNIIEDSSSSGIYGENADSGFRMNVDGNTIRRSSGYGIRMEHYKTNITDNTIRNSGDYQIRLYYAYYPSSINDNDIRNGHYGIGCWYSYMQETDNNIIINHTWGYAAYYYYTYRSFVFTNNQIDWSESGVYYYDWTGGTGSFTFDNNTIENTTDGDAFHAEFYFNDGTSSIQDNVIKNAYYGGIRVRHYGYDNLAVYIRNNYIYNTSNDWAFEFDGYWDYFDYGEFYDNVFDENDYGAYIYGVWAFNFRRNTITNTWGEAAGIETYGPLNVTDNTMTGNSRWGWEDVLYAYGDWYDSPARVLRNNISDNNNGYAIGIYGFGDVLLQDNLLNNNGYGLYIEVNNLVSRNNQYNNNDEYGVEVDEIYGNAEFYNDQANDNGYEGMYIEDVEGYVIVANGTYNNNPDGGLYIEYIYGGLVTVENCTLDGNGYGIYTYRTYYGVDFHDNYVANNTWYGSEFDNNDYQGIVHVHHNIYFSNDEHYYSYESPVIIEWNSFERGSYGVDAYDYGSSIFIFRNNTMEGVSQYGIWFYYPSFRAPSGIYDNTFKSFGEAIYVEDQGDGFPIFNNMFTQGQTGIFIEDSSPYIHHNTFRILSQGIYSYQASARIEHNTFTNSWNYGIYLENDRGSTISDNTFTYSQRGLFAEGSNLDLHRNTFQQNQYGAVINSSFSTLVDNDFYDNDYGLFIGEYAFASITGGDFSFNYQYGIWSDVGTFSSWTVKGQSTVASSVLVLNGDLTIQDGGHLSLVNAKVQLRSFGGIGFKVLVDDGAVLEASGSTFEPVNRTRPFGIFAEAGSTIHLDDCDLLGLAGGASPRKALSIMTSDAVLEKVRVTDSVDVALFVDGGVDFTMRNGSIANSGGYDVHILNDSVLRMGNTDFDPHNVLVLDTSKIIIERVISVKALDDGDHPYMGVGISVTDDEDATITGSTDANGMWWQFFEGAIISSTGMADTEETYELEVSDGDQTFMETVELTDDFLKTYRFGLPPVTLNGTSAIEIDEDTVYILDLKLYFFDNDMLTYSVKGNTSLMFDFDGDMGWMVPALDWYGHEDVTLVATDTHGISVQYDLSVTVRPVNDIPILSGVPDLTFNEDEDFELDLLPYIDDPDTPQSGLTVTVDSMYGTVLRTTVTFNFPDASIQYVRLGVFDQDGGTYQDILVSVLEINDAPVIEGIPVQNATEDVEKTVDFLPWLVDDDNNVSNLVITSDSEFVVSIDGTKVTFLFPDGPEQRFAPVTISDGEAMTTQMIEFSVMPVNDPPEIATLPLLTVTEGEDFVFELSTYLSDIDNELDDLTVSVDNPYVTIDGHTLIINMPDSSVLITITVTVSDGELQSTAPLRITVDPVNDPPTLTDPRGPKGGAEGDDYKFSVTFTDPDATNPVVFVVINGQRYAMKHTSGDFASGARFEINLKSVLDPDDYTYRFEAEDGSGEPNGFARTQDFTGLTIEAQANYWWVVVLIIILAVVALFLIMRRPRKDSAPTMMDEQEDMDEDETDEEEPEDSTLDDFEDDTEEPEDVEEVDEEPAPEPAKYRKAKPKKSGREQR